MEEQRSFRPERFISSGDEEFQNDWDIIESEEAAEEDKAHRDKSADDEVLEQERRQQKGGAKAALIEVASQFGFGTNPRRG